MSHRPVRSARHVTTALVTLLAVSGLVACAARTTTDKAFAAMPVPVTLLTQAAPLGDAPAQPIYALVLSDSDWEPLDGQIPEAALQGGRQADHAAQVIVVAFAGVKGSSGYQVSVREAALQASELIITVAITAPGADDIVEPASTLPFALAAIPRDALAAARSYAIVDEGGHTLIRNQITAP